MNDEEIVLQEVSYNPTVGHLDDEEGEEEGDELPLYPISLRRTNSHETRCRIIRDAIGLLKTGVGEAQESKIIHRFTLINCNDISVQVMTYGATITSIKMQDKKGHFDDIVLGYESSESYRKIENPYFGATIGRITGVIPQYVFSIDEEKYYVTNNYLSGHHANGGFVGFDKVLWNSFVSNDKLHLSYMSKNMEEGFPGDVLVNRCYELTTDNRLVITTIAKCTKPTPVDVTTHVDFNLSSHLGGPSELYKHYLMINADKYGQVDKNHFMTGKLKKVHQTVLDLRIPRPIGKVIHKIPGGGFDHFMNLTRGTDKSVIFAARLMHPDSGRYVEILTDQPGLHVYSQNNLYAIRNLVEGHPISCWCHDPKHLLEMRSPCANFEISGNPETGDVRLSKKSIPSRESTSKKSIQSKESKKSKPESESGERLPKKSQVGSVSGRLSKKIEMQQEGEIEEYAPAEEETLSEESEAPYGPLKGKLGAEYVRHSGIRLVPVNYPEPVAKKKNYDKYLLYPGETYTNTTIFKFCTIYEKPPNLAEVAIE